MVEALEAELLELIVSRHCLWPEDDASLYQQPTEALFEVDPQCNIVAGDELGEGVSLTANGGFMMSE